MSMGKLRNFPVDIRFRPAALKPPGGPTRLSRLEPANCRMNKSASGAAVVAVLPTAAATMHRSGGELLWAHNTSHTNPAAHRRPNLAVAERLLASSLERANRCLAGSVYPALPVGRRRRFVQPEPIIRPQWRRKFMQIRAQPTKSAA